MTSKPASSSSLWDSPLVRQFVERSEDATPTEAIQHHVALLRKAVQAGSELRDFGPYFAQRHILETLTDTELPGDGYLEPKGSRFENGFRLVLKKQASHNRLRFTIAHEICHTFFYELVPEIKYMPHSTDEAEERLCNLGAAELLMPRDQLLARASDAPVSLESLDFLSELYGVSMETMFVRLRSLRLWQCEVTIWHRMVDGSFALDRIYGRTRANWCWADSIIPEKGWERSHRKPITGKTIIRFEDKQGIGWAKPIYYQAARRANSLVALWSARAFKRSRVRLPLLQQHDRPAIRPVDNLVAAKRNPDFNRVPRTLSPPR